MSSGRQSRPTLDAIRRRGGAFSAALPVLPLLALALTAPEAALGQTTTRDRPRVVLLALTADDPLAGRLVAELESLGLSVVRAAIDPTVVIEDSVRKALGAGARAVVIADGRRTEFWIAEEGSDRVALRQELEIENSPALESVLSLRTVEFLRVSLGLVSSTGSPAQPPGGGARGRENRPDLDRRFSLALSSGLLASTGRLAPFVVVGVELRGRVTGPLAVELRGYAPIGSQILVQDRGEVRASVWLAGAGLVLAPRTGARLSGEVGAGMMTAIVRAAGTSDNIGYDGRVAYVVGVAAYARGAARLRLAAGWSLRLDVIAGTTTLRRPVIAIAPLDDAGQAQDVTPWGTVFGAGLAGLEVYF